MTYTVGFNIRSANRKTGPIPVSTTEKKTCPISCPMKAGCYAKFGPLNIHWDRLSDGRAGFRWETFIGLVKSLPINQLWRHNQAGDLPGDGINIDKKSLKQLVRANKGKKGFTYTHYLPLDSNKEAIKDSNKSGFTINLSANNLVEADKYKKMRIGPVVVVLPKTQTTNTITPNGNKVIVCPATYRSNVNCSSCGLCQKANRSVIIGFPAHGNGINNATAVANGV